ncbi:MAG: ABC transporter substrate-binding protein [Chloroflexi bacterium]|nr:ABC transporter substrate-binding protein [Chloroflexota bacterium]
MRRCLIWVRVASLIVPLVVACAPASPAPEKPAAAKPAETKQEVAKPAESKPPAAKPAESKPEKSEAAKPAEKPATKPALAVVKVGALPLHAVAGVFIGQEKGYFAEQGIQMEFQDMATTTDQYAPLATGEIAVASIAIGAGLVNAVARGIPLKIAIGGHTVFAGKPTATSVVIRKALLDSGQIKSPADFKGRTIALESRGIGPEIWFVRLLQQGGLKYPDDVNVTTIPMPDMIAAYANGAIDLSSLSEPFVARGIDQGALARYKEPFELYPTHQITGIVFSANFANNQTDLAKRFTVGYLKGVRDYLDAFSKGKDKEAIIQALMRYTTVKERALYDKIVPVTLAPNGEIRPEDIDFQQTWFLQSGVIKETIPASRLIDTQFVKYAVEKLGEYK